jgi:hypothetical protein
MARGRIMQANQVRLAGPESAYLFLRQDGPAAPLWLRCESAGELDLACPGPASVEVADPFTAQVTGLLPATFDQGRLRCHLPEPPGGRWLRVTPQQ